MTGNRNVGYLRAVARLKPDVPFAQARSEIATIGDRLSRDASRRRLAWRYPRLDSSAVRRVARATAAGACRGGGVRSGYRLRQRGEPAPRPRRGRRRDSRCGARSARSRADRPSAADRIAGALGGRGGRIGLGEVGSRRAPAAAASGIAGLGTTNGSAGAPLHVGRRGRVGIAFGLMPGHSVLARQPDRRARRRRERAVPVRAARADARRAGSRRNRDRAGPARRLVALVQA